MHIGILLDPYGEKSPGGLGRAVFEMAKHVLELDMKNTYTVFVKKYPKQKPELPGSHWNLVGLQSKYLWLTGAKKLDRTLDLYIFFTPLVPLFFRPKKSIVVALDWAYLSVPPRSIREACAKRILFFLHRRSLRLATKIISISQYTKSETVRHFSIDPAKIEVVHIGFVAPPNGQKLLDVPEHYFIFGGVLKERKNVAGIIHAFTEYTKAPHADHMLLIAGKGGGEYHQSLVALVQELNLQDRVTFLGYVTDQELAYLYAHATALVFPSFIEGFGMPVLEAMSVGLPVITSNNGALAEVGGAAALLVDPHDHSAIAKAMESLANHHEIREALKQKGYARAAQFTWQRTAKGFLDIIEKLSGY